MRMVRIMAIAALLAGTAPALSQSWPTRPMTLVVPFAAGGTSDVIARLLAEGLRAQLGQPVLVENVGGAGGMVGGSRVAKSPPDGYQMVLGNVGTHAQNQSLYKRPLYNAASDFAPVALVADQSLALVAGKDFRPTICASSRPTQKPISRRCNMARAVPAAPIIWPVRCSTRHWGSISLTFHIEVVRRRCRTCWQAASTTSARARLWRCHRSTPEP